MRESRPADIESMYRAAMAELAHKPDPAKGKTALEWAELFSEWDETSVGEQGARNRIRKLVAAKKMVRDTDWRVFDGTMRRTPVYRFSDDAANNRPRKAAR